MAGQNNMPPTGREQELLAQIAELQKKLGHAEGERDSAQEQAKALAEASVFFGSNGAEEQPTGRTITKSVCANPGVTKESKQVWKDVEVPTFYYTIDLPPGAGTELLTNGVPFYHGETYEVDQETLVDLKSRVARTWDHERAIHSDNANAYRKQTKVHLKSAAALRAGL